MSDLTHPLRDRQATEQRLLDAALTEFSAAGFHGTSVKTISESSGVNVALINRYFGGKDGLLVAIVERFIDEKQRGDLPYPPQKTLRSEIAEYLKHRYLNDMEHKAFIRLVISEIAVNRAFRERALVSFQYAGDENFMRRLEILQKKGLVGPEVDLTALFRTISLISFSASFIEGEVLSIASADTLEHFDTVAAQLSR